MDEHTTTEDMPGTADDDRSTRAKIRDAALRQFARHGFRGATVRGIAREAGVSPGLVQHHFGTKQALREACDEYAFSIFQRAAEEGYRGGAVDNPDFIAEILGTMMPIMDYIVAQMASGSPTASTWFQQFVEFNSRAFEQGVLGGPLPEDQDVTAIAAVVASIQLGLVMMWEHLLRALDAEPNDPSAIVRIGRARLFVVSGGLFDPDVVERIREGLDRYEQMYGTQTAPDRAGEQGAQS